MLIVRIICVFSLIINSGLSVLIAQDKEWEKDIIYSEEQVPYYELPDPMVTIEGKRVTSVMEWEHIRRPQIMGMFASTIYGKVPQPEEEITHEIELLGTDNGFLDGKCTRKQVQFRFSNHRGTVEMHMVVFLPNNKKEPVPLLLQLSFDRAQGKSIETENIQSYGRLRNGTPLIHFIENGFGVAIINGGEVVQDEYNFRGNTIHKLFYKGNQSLPRADEWGVFGGIAWQASRAMDYLETDADVDHSKVALLGFSKLGKCALWAAAQDTRFAMVLSQNSGCAGAALWRRSYGENLKYMLRFPYWLCSNARKYVGNENDLPVDQHMLLACIAPRPVYVTSGFSDYWADPMGEYLATHHATPVYELYGLKGQATRERPQINQPTENRALSYVVRSGGHGYLYKDWDRYIDFMKFHF